MRQWTLFLVAIALHSASMKGAEPRKPIDARLPKETARLKSLPAQASLLEPPLALVQPLKEGKFTIAKKPPAIQFAKLPGQQDMPHAETWLYSHWGDALAASDGNFYVAFGDHQAVPGQAWVCRLNPNSGRIDIVVDVNKVLKPAKGEYSPGKIHAPLIDGGDGYIYFMPYRGSEKYADSPYGFAGGHLLRYHMESERTQDLGIPLPHCSVPHIVFDQTRGRLYLFGRYCPSMPEPRHNKFGVYDLAEQQVVHIASNTCKPEEAPRAAIVGGDGRVWYGTESHVMAVYHPQSNKTFLTKTPVIADVRYNRKTKQEEKYFFLRTASEADEHGIAYCLTWDAHYHAFNSKTGKFKPLGVRSFLEEVDKAKSLYTGSVEWGPGRKKLYYVPGSHGRSHFHGTALVQFDPSTRKHKVLAFLQEYVREKTGFPLGGTYGLAFNEDYSQLCILWNDERIGNAPERERRVGVMLVRIPASEH